MALSAAYLMSKNSGQEKLAWCMFLMADVTHVIYYNHTGQTGLVYFTMFKKKQVAKDNKKDNKNTAISY